MTNTEILLLTVFFISLLLSAFFSALETAIISLDKIRLHHDAQAGNKKAGIMLALLEHIDLLISSCLIGNNLTIITASAMVGTLMSIWKVDYGWIGMAILSLETAIFLIFGEILPKVYFRAHANQFVLAVLSALRLMTWIFSPILWLIKMLNQLALKDRFRGTYSISRGELEHLFHMSGKTGIIDDEGSDFIADVFEFGKITAREVMVATINIISLEHRKPLAQVARLTHDYGYARIPIFESRVDNIIGYISTKQLLQAKRGDSIADHLQKTIYIPFTKKISELYTEMKSLNLELVFVVNEYGAVAGMITLEDIVEEIVGEIRTSDHPEEKTIYAIHPNLYHADGGLNIDDFNKIFHTRIEKQGFETIAGYITYKFGKIPDQGAKLTYQNLILIALEVTQTSVKKIEIKIQSNNY